MNCIELSNNELQMVDGGSFWTYVGETASGLGGVMIGTAIGTSMVEGAEAGSFAGPVGAAIAALAGAAAFGVVEYYM